MKKNPFKLKIGTPIEVDWSEGKFLDFDQSSADPRFGREPLEEERRQFRYWWVVAPLLVVFCILVGRLVDLQIFRGPYYLALAEGNRLRVQKLLAPRGLIKDRAGAVIVHNEPSFEIVFTPLDLPRDPAARFAVADRVADFFGLERSAVRAALASAGTESFLPVTIKQGIKKEQAIVFITRAGEFPGFAIQNNPERFYESGPVFAHVIGYTGKLNPGEYEKLKTDGYQYNDIIGKNGLEASYESYVRGELGERLVEVDAKGVVKNTFRQKDPQPGDDLELYLDVDLQRVLYDSLQAHMQQQHASRAAAVALDPVTGGVLALVSLPSFDNNWFAQGITDEQYQSLVTDRRLPLFNRVTSGTYPPGSTVKPVLATAALQEKIVTPQTEIFDGGQITVPNQFNPNIIYTFRGWKPGGLGSVNVRQAIALSSDIYFYTVGGGQLQLKIDGLGPQLIADYLRRFYLGQVTGIDLPTEKTGLIPTPEWKVQHFAGNAVEEQWFLGDTYNMSIGQGFVLVTPLQLAVATAALANGGTVFQPRLVHRIVDRTGREVKNFSPIALNTGFVEAQYLSEAREGMRQAVVGGTARLLNTIPLNIAGKTGTSQFDESDLSRTHAWFTAFAPFEDPKIVLTVLIESGGEGSGAAVPVAKDVFDWYSKNRR